MCNSDINSPTPFSLDILKDIPGRRLDAFLAQRFPDYSRAFVQKLIDAGQVTVNGQAAGNPKGAPIAVRIASHILGS